MVKLPLAIEYALLGFLRERPLHAYEIHQTLLRPEALGLVWHLKQSLVYVMLERLEEAGYLTTTLEPQNSRPPRKLLHLTNSGRAAFERWQITPVEHGREFRLEFLAKPYFAKQDDPAVVASLLTTQRVACQGGSAICADRPIDWRTSATTTGWCCSFVSASSRRS